jgi:Ca2+-binding RTX toxin-like protein
MLSAWGVQVDFQLISGIPWRAYEEQVMETRVVTLPDDVPLPALVNAAWGVDDDVRINGVRLGTGYADYGSTDVLVSSRTLTIDLLDTVGGNSGGRVELNLVSADTGFDGDPSDRRLIEDIAASGGQLRFFDGALWSGDDGVAAVGLRRDSTGGASSGVLSPFGRGWSLLGAPTVASFGPDPDDPTYVSLAFGGNDTRVFRNIAPTGEAPVFERVGVQDSRDQLTMADGQFAYLTASGSAFTFERCDTTVPVPQRGQLISRVDSMGNRVDVSFNTDGTTSQRTTTVAGESTAHQIETYYYLPPTDPNNPGGVSQIDITRGDGTLLRSVFFEYYGDGAAFGAAGDLASVAVQDSSGALVDMRRYRYTAAPDGGSLLQYAFDADGLNYALSEERDPLTDSSASMAEYAKHFFDYDTQGRVTRHDVQTGPTFYVGIDTFTYTYTANLSHVVDSDLDWRMKITETRPFGVERIVYSNGRNQPMLEVIRTSDGGVTQQYGTYTRYDTRGDVIWRVSPENITLPEDLADIEQYPDLFPATSGSFPNISTSTGQVKQLTLDPAVLWGGVRFDFENHWSVPSPPPGVADYAFVAETRVVSLPDSVALPSQVLISWAADDDVRLNGVRLGTGIANAGTRLVTVYTRDLVLDLIDTVGGASGGTVTLSLNNSPDTPPVYATFVDGRLSITGTAAGETITVGTVDVDGVLQVAVNDVAFAWGVLAQDVTSIVVNLGDGNDAIDLTLLAASGFTGLTDGSVTINGGAGDDTIAGSAFGDTIDGGDGDDVIDGREGNDLIHGGSGDDQLYGNLGNDVVVPGFGGPTSSSPHDFLAGGDGDDTYVFDITGYDTALKTIEEDENGGSDRVDVTALPAPVFVSTSRTDVQRLGEYASLQFVTAGSVETVVGNRPSADGSGIYTVPGESDHMTRVTFRNAYNVPWDSLYFYEVDENGCPLHPASPDDPSVPSGQWVTGGGAYYALLEMPFPGGARLAFFIEHDGTRLYSIPAMNADGPHVRTASNEAGEVLFSWEDSPQIQPDPSDPESSDFDDIILGVGTLTTDNGDNGPNVVAIVADDPLVNEDGSATITFTFMNFTDDGVFNDDDTMEDHALPLRTRPLFVPFVLAPGSSARVGADFLGLPGGQGEVHLIKIPVGEATATLTLTINDDDEVEGDEWFGFTTGWGNYLDLGFGSQRWTATLLAGQSDRTTILDDDEAFRDGPFGVQNNGAVSAEDGELWVYAAIPDDVALEDPSVPVTFELLRTDGTPTGVIGSAVPVRGLAYTTLVLPPELLSIDPFDPAASTYRVRATYGDLMADGRDATVEPGLAANIEAIATVTFASRPGFSYSVGDDNVPFLRDFADGTGSVSVTATIRDKRGNLVADGTPVTWATVDDAFTPTDIENVTEETVNGVATFAIHSSRIAPVTRLSVTADDTTLQGFLSGGELTVTVALFGVNGQPASDQEIDLDQRSWFSTRSETIRVRATITRSDGSPVGAGVSVRFHDTKSLLGDATVVTDEDGVATIDLFVPSDRAAWSILGRNVVTATAAGYAAAKTILIKGSIPPPVEIEFNTPFLAGNVTEDGSVDLPNASADGFTATMAVAYVAHGTVVLRNLVPGTSYRLEVPANSPVGFRVPNTAAPPSSEVSFQPTGSTFTILVDSLGTLTGKTVSIIKPLLYAESTLWNWFEDPVGYSVRGDGAGTLIVGPSSTAAWLELTSRTIVNGALFGSSGLDGSLAGDVALSLIPGVGVYPDARDLGRSLLSLLPVDLGLGPFDRREAAIAAFGILTEVLPMVDPFVDAFRTLYKVARHSSAVMPVFLSVEPLFMKALRRAFGYSEPAGLQSPTETVTESSLALMSANGAASAAASASLRDILRKYMGGVLSDDEAVKLINHVELAGKLIGDNAFLQAYKRLAQVSGSKLADDLSTVIEHFGMDNVVAMLKRGDSSVADFGDGLNAMASAIRRNIADYLDWKNGKLLEELHTNPTQAAEIMMSLGKTSRMVIESQTRFASKLAGTTDVAKAVAIVTGRAGGKNGTHSFVETIDQLQNFANDLESVMERGIAAAAAPGGDTGTLHRMIVLVRRFHTEKPHLPTQSGRLLELQEAAHAFNAHGSVTVGYNVFTSSRFGRTDIDLKIGADLAVEIKQSVERFSDKEMITKFVKYWAAMGSQGHIELRSFDSVDVMRDKVMGVLDTYINKSKPRWLEDMSVKDDVLVAIKNAMTFDQITMRRYNFYTGATST